MVRTSRRLSRSGISLIEVLLVIGILGVMTVLISPRISGLRSQSALRATRQEVASAFAAARAAALQKGKTATLTLTSTSASVSVMSGLAGNPVQVFGPLRFNTALNSSLTAINTAPMTISFDARGLLTPTPAGISKYRITNGIYTDSLCISAAGIILSRACEL